ncbi:ABC transporter ATP-binding protein [Tengunoibacter tsumagoiensis]|uniref:Helicase n=1 Tax=Tengunoibacter tsumagoiensis TaxID=2014871 RepID=A0A402A6W0_9CHLR|nr:ABC transporter ATP-binding protein [Tengunoibacter tsumagoiensis]GCE14829.1 helicase [Tengunoibacter tsumagoiensis]
MTLHFAQYRDLLLRYLRPQWPKFVLMTITLLGSIALELYNPQILKTFIDTVKAQGNLNTLVGSAILFLIVALGAQIVSSAATYMSSDVGWTATNSMREEVALHCIELDMAFHKAHMPGELLERIDGDVGTLSSFFSTFIIQIVGHGLLMLGILLIVAFINIWIGLALILYSVGAFLALRRLQSLGVPIFVQQRQLAADLVGFYEEHMNGILDVITSGGSAYVIRRYIDLQRRVNSNSYRSGFVEQGMRIAVTMFLVLGNIIVVVGGTYLLLDRQITLGAIIMLSNYVMIFTNQLVNLSFTFNTWQLAAASMKRIAELYYTPSRVQDGPGIGLSAGEAASITFDHVSFGYDEGQTILHDVTFELAAGEILGIIGRSGSGKTSLTRLLFRFYDPTSGTIKLNGEDIRQANIAELRHNIGIVTQEVQLFNASLRDNLTFFDDRIPDEQLLTFIEELGLGDWYRDQPAGLDTELTAGGGGLSAGEAQLLALIRVFLKNPCLVILDEASSRLDMATERLCMNATTRLLAKRTGLIIAHRLATVEQVDKILVLEAGHIVEYGPRVALAKDPMSRYSKLLRTMNSEETFA